QPGRRPVAARPGRPASAGGPALHHPQQTGPLRMVAEPLPKGPGGARPAARRSRGADVRLPRRHQRRRHRRDRDGRCGPQPTRQGQDQGAYPHRTAPLKGGKRVADTNVDPDLEYALEKMRDQRPGYDEAEVFYEGRPQEVFSTAEVKRLLAKSSLDELRNINFSKTAVTAILDLIQVEKVIVTHPDGRPHEEAQQALNALWRYNKLDLELPKLWEKVSVFGDGYLFVWPVLDDNNNIVTVDILVNDPRSVTAVYDEERPRDLDYTLKVWCSNRTKGKEVHEARLYYDDQIR